MRSKPLKPLSTEVEALLQHERSIERVPPELAARVLARARAAHNAGGSGPFSSSSLRRLWLFGATGVGVGALAFAALRETSTTDLVASNAPTTLSAVNADATHLEAAPPVASVVSGAAVASQRSPETSASTIPGAGPAAAPPERPTANSVDARVDELAALKQARSAVARADYAAALRLLDAHRRAFPKGRLLEEGEALRIKALWGSGRRDQARSALTSFQRRFPGSVLGAGLKATVQASP